jgi:hypothetical protein
MAKAGFISDATLNKPSNILYGYESLLEIA